MTVNLCWNFIPHYRPHTHVKVYANPHEKFFFCTNAHTHICKQSTHSDTEWQINTHEQTSFCLYTSAKHTCKKTHRNGHSLLGFLAAAIIDAHRQVMDQPQPLCNLDLFLLRQLTRWPTDIGWRMVDGDNLGFLQSDEWENLLQRVPVMYRWWVRGFVTEGASNVQVMSERICYRGCQ